jgi:hypothetical protein
MRWRDATDDDARLSIGAARNAALLELLTVPTMEGAELAIHVVGRRSKCRRLLREQ